MTTGSDNLAEGIQCEAPARGGSTLTLDKILTEIIQREGGFSDRPEDRGGPTRFGVTQATLSRWLGRGATVDEVRNLSEATARQIYTKRYWLEPGLDRVPGEELQAVLLDCAVHHGPEQSIKFLQAALGVKEDGVLGPVTLAALPHLDGRRITIKVLANRVRLFGKIISRDRSQAVFAGGWLARAADLLEDVA